MHRLGWRRQSTTIKEDVLASVLLDLSQTATQDASVNVARKVLKNFEHIGEFALRLSAKGRVLVLKSLMCRLFWWKRHLSPIRRKSLVGQYRTSIKDSRCYF